MESSKYQEKKMSFNIEWFEIDDQVICYINIYNYKILFNDYLYVFFQYVCFAIIYVLIMKLIKDILNEDSDEYF
jgi:hypothetical protein